MTEKYLRHQKSSNNAYQRKSYSGQKKSHLCKPFTVCTTNGFVVDVPGPFTANLNDAEIMKIVMKDGDKLRELLKPGDIFVLDRGFRDVKSWLEEQGYVVLMPALKGKRKQLTTQESNASRFVTKVRWVVEAVHGMIGQRFKLLHHQLHNQLLPKTAVLCHIVCYLCNQYQQRLTSDVGLEERILERMRSNESRENEFANEVEEKNWGRRKQPFKKLNSNDIEDFPVYTDEELTIFFTGTYQLKQAISYLAEIREDDGTIKVDFLEEYDDSGRVLKLEVQSRHIARQKWRVFIKYDDTAIIGHVCS